MRSCRCCCTQKGLKAKRMAELESANASSKEVADELARLDEDRRKEGLKIEVRMTRAFVVTDREQHTVLDVHHGH